MKPGRTCKWEIERMLKNSQTKAIFPVMLLGLLRSYRASKKLDFTDSDIAKAYEAAVQHMRNFLGHDVHIGGKYYDTYSSRMSRYGVLESVGHLQYRLASSYAAEVDELLEWIPQQIQLHIENRLGIVPHLQDTAKRAAFAENLQEFSKLIHEQIGKTPANFEIFTFAVIKVHLEKFACKIYRDTRTSAHDSGVDLSTNFGVVYQVKKLKVHTETEAKRLYDELKLNFDKERLQDGNVILVIDDISKQIKQYLIDMKIQSISKDEVLKMASNLEDAEDRQKVLRIVYDEFRREYSSRVP